MWIKMDDIYNRVKTFIKRKWWYIVLLIGSSIYVFRNRSIISCLDFEIFTTAHLIFILWIILLLMPLFSEMEFFGVKLKKEVEKTRTEVKDSVNDLKMQLVQLQATNNVSNSFQFGNSTLPSEDKLEELIQFVRNTQKKTEKSDEDVSASPKEDENRAVYLFKIRFSIEKALTQLIEKLGYDEKMPLMKMIHALYKGEMIDGITADLITQVIKITNRGVHGEIVSEEYIDFIRKTYPEIQQKLEEAKDNLHPVVCPRCKYKGYSRYENVCPNCGFTFCEE